MLDWIITAAVLNICFLVMVTGGIKYLFVLWLVFLLNLVVLSFSGRIWVCFRKKNDK